MSKEQLIQVVCKGDASAAEFLFAITDVAHVWDDLIDQDRDVRPEEINRAFMNALVGLPRNAFYARHFDLLHPVLISAVNNWQVANQLEQAGSSDDLHIAFITRSSYVDLVTQVAFILGGPEWVRSVGPEIRRFAHAEGWEKYVSNLDAEHAARKRRTQGD